jgi:hypothetical protein
MLFQRLGPALKIPVDQRPQEIVLGREVVGDPATGHAALTRQFLEGERRRAALANDSGGSVEDLLAGFGCTTHLETLQNVLYTNRERRARSHVR